MDDPCPHCGQPAPADSPNCPACNSSLLVDLAAAPALGDARVAYEIARLAKDRWDDLHLVSFKRGLEEGKEPIVSGVTRARSLEIATFLAEHGIGVSARPMGAAMPGPPPPVESARPWWIAVTLVTLVMAGITALIVYQATQMPPPEAKAKRLSPTATAQLALPATVILRCPEKDSLGFFAAPEIVVTNSSALCGERIKTVLADGRELGGRVLRTDQELGLAVVHLPGTEAAPLDLGDVTALKTGDRARFLSMENGAEFRLIEGRVRAPTRERGGVLRMVLETAAGPSDDGTAVLNSAGKVVGVLLPRTNRSSRHVYALPINYFYEGPDAVFLRPPGADAVAWARLLPPPS